MNATIYYEPYRFPAGILALVVHGVFFALLFFGFNWNRQVFSPPTMQVELWQSLPEATVTPPVQPKVEEVVPPPPQPEKPVEPDIVIPENKKVVVKPIETKPEKKVTKPIEKVKPDNNKKKLAEQKELLAKQQKAREVAERIRKEEQAASEQAARERAAREQAERNRQDELAAAEGRVVDEYRAKIQAKIRRNIVEPPDVSPDARAEFRVTLLPGGAVLPPRLTRSSGNAAYDDAVERAILKSDPLPLPPDVKLFNRFRVLDLVFKPEKTN